MKKNIFAIFAVLVMSSVFVTLSAQDSEAEKGNESEEKSYDFSGYMETINSLKKSINEKMPAYQEAAKKLFPKSEAEKSEDGTTIVLSTYEKKFVGSFVPYFFRDYTVVNGDKVSMCLEKTVSDLILEKAQSIDNSGSKETDNTVPFERLRIIEVAGDDADSISVIYRSSLGSDHQKKLSDFKELRSQIRILNQIRGQLITTERVMDITIHRSELLKEFVNDKAIVNFELQP